MLIGTLCAFDTKKRSFNRFEVHLIEIFARYIANEISRSRMDNQLRHNQEMKMLGQLTSGVAHEVRNPLNAINVLIEALFVDLKNTAVLDSYKTHLTSQVKRLTNLMEDLLSLGRPLQRENMTVTTIGCLVKEIISSYAHGLVPTNNPVELTMIDKAEEAQIRCDVLRLQQVIINLIENAQQHSCSSVPIRVVIEIVEKHTIRIRVVDSGEGIPEKNLPNIFEPFFTTRKYGTGLGLSIVRHIVQSHNGKIEIYNNKEQVGTTAEIRLPLTEEFPVGIQEPNLL
jgi:signal transduction histidine kinase